MKQYVIVIFIAVCTSVLTLLPPDQAQGITDAPRTIIVWSPDGQKIAIGAFSEGLWISADGLVSQLSDMASINDFAWSPDSNRLAILRSISFVEANIEIWDVTKPHTPQLLSVILDDGVDVERNPNIDWHPTSNLLAVSGRGVRIWNADTGQLLRHLEVETREFTTNVHWSPDGMTLIGLRSSLEKRFFQWDTQLGSLIQDVELRTISLVWGDDPQSFVARISDSSGVRLVIASVSQPNTVLSNLTCDPRCPTILDWQGNTIAGLHGANNRNNVALWDVSTGQIITTITDLAGPGFALDPSGGCLAYIQEGSLELVIVPVPDRPQSPDIPPPASN